MSNAQQRSREKATQDGINALMTAASGVQTIEQHAESSFNNLTRSYQGADGAAFQRQLLDPWLSQVESIRGSLNQIVEHMNNTLRMQRRQQQSTTAQIEQSSQQAQAVYNVLQG